MSKGKKAWGKFFYKKNNFENNSPENPQRYPRCANSHCPKKIVFRPDAKFVAALPV